MTLKFCAPSGFDRKWVRFIPVSGPLFIFVYRPILLNGCIDDLTRDFAKFFLNHSQLRTPDFDLTFFFEKKKKKQTKKTKQNKIFLSNLYFVNYFFFFKIFILFC